MRNVLLVKTSSMGDVVHNLPVVGDIVKHLPNVSIDWVIEESFADIPRMHPAIRRVIPIALRRWRDTLTRRETWRGWRAFHGDLRREHYDVILDTQGLVKSAFIARLARGTRAGFDWSSAREPVAALAYRERFSVAKNLHAVVRNRRLAAAALRYSIDDRVDYGLRAPSARPSGLPSGRYAVLLHATSRADKTWAASNWIEIGARLQRQGIATVLPWGSAAERAQAESLSQQIAESTITPKSTLLEMVSIISCSVIVVGVDTGLTHLAAALGTPVAAIYCASDPILTGVYGALRAVNLGNIGAPPSADEVWQAALRLTKT